MKSKNDDTLLDDIVIAAATTANTAPITALSDNPLMELALLELMDRRKRKEEERADQQRFLLARTEDHKHETARKIAGQAACNHIKERGYGSRVGGQRLSNNHFAYLCQFCGKEWDETSLPAHLAIPMEFVGG